MFCFRRWSCDGDGHVADRMAPHAIGSEHGGEVSMCREAANPILDEVSLGVENDLVAPWDSDPFVVVAQ